MSLPSSNDPDGSANNSESGNVSPNGSGVANSFQMPPRNPVLESFVNDTQGSAYQDPQTALSAAESRCVGLVASAEGFAQQRHAKLQQLFKQIQMANNEEVGDLSGRVSICEAALQELSESLESTSMHIASATNVTHDFIRNCTVERGKSEGRLLSTLNSMLIDYEQQRRTWRRQAAQTLIMQDTEGLKHELQSVASNVIGITQQEEEEGGDDEKENQHQQEEPKTPTSTTTSASAATAAAGGKANQQPKQRKQEGEEENDEDEDRHSHIGFLSLEQDHHYGQEKKKKKSNDNNNNNNNNKSRKQQRQEEEDRLLRYLPKSVREKRKTILQRFAQLLGQMLIDGDNVDRPFLLDATYARVIRYADVLTLHGETMCRQIAEMFDLENTKRTHFLLDGEREIFKQNSEALCPPSLVPIGNEPVYTVFVQQLVAHRLEREVKCLQMMDAGLEQHKQIATKAIESSTGRFYEAVRQIINTITKHGVVSLASSSSSSNNNGGENVSNASMTSNSNNNATNVAGGGGTGRFGRSRLLTSGSTFGGSVGSGNSAGGGGGGSISSATEATVGAIVAKLLSSSFGEQLPEENSIEAEIQSKERNSMNRIFVNLLREVARVIDEAHTTLSSTFHDTVAAVQPSPINLVSNSTVFSLDSLQAELHHQALLLKLASASEGTERSRLAEQLKQEKHKNSALEHDLDEKTRLAITLQSTLQDKEDECHELETSVRLRTRTQMNLKNEIKKLNYALTSDCFGKGWQESILMIRESMMKQALDEQQRLLYRVKAYQKQKFDDQNRVVALIESGFLATSEEIEADHSARIKENQIRHEVEMQRVRDECELRVKNAHTDAHQEIKKSREAFEQLYFDRVNELNGSYDEKVRQIEMRQRDWEDRLWAKMKQIRQDFREKENNTERQYAKKHEAVLKIYEEEANLLKKNIADKEARLESERLSVHLEIERQINEGVRKVKESYESVRSNLQSTMLGYLEKQRLLFEDQREQELELFSEFAFGGMKFAKDTAFSIVETNRKTFQQQVDESQKSVQDATLTANDVTGRLLKHRDELHENRMIGIKANNEQVLRKTQLVRIEQDEKTWNSIHKEIVHKGSELDQKQAHVEELMAQRYIDIVRTLHTYIQGDVNAAHQTFEQECAFRQEQLRRYLNHFHGISLRIESTLWLETSARNDLEREALSILNLLTSRSRTEAEYVIRNQMIQAHVSNLNPDAEETTFTTVEGLRARYEGLLRRQHQLMGAMSHDYVSSLQHYTTQHNAAAEATSAIFAARMDEMHVAMRKRWELHWASRDMLVERTLENLVHDAARSCPEVLGNALSPNSATAAQFYPSSSSSSPSSPSSDGKRRMPLSPSQRQQQQQQQQQQGSNNNNNNNVVSVSGGSTMVVMNDGESSSSSASAATAAAGGGGNISQQQRPSVTFALDSNNRLEMHQQQQSQSQQQQQQQQASSQQGATAPPLFYAQDLRVVEYFTAMREVLAKTFEQMDSKITAGLEQRELKQRQHSVEMRARFLDAATALTRRAEQLEDKVLDSKMEANSLRAQLHLKSEAEIRAAVLADDLKALVGHYRLLTQNVLIHGSFASENQQQQIRENMAQYMNTSGVGGGSFKRQALLSSKSTNQNQHSSHHPTSTSAATSASLDDSSSSTNRKKEAFQAMFLLDVGGKKATRDIVMENALLRERLLASEWKNDKFLRDAMLASGGARGDL